ncbi:MULTISPECIES: BON domain-containing protein [Chryseobacterium]|uniref:BON domain-containing protein n=1 Tax=Chryseobacterium TaxID=59732 RepID=UPI001C0F6C4B|nr:MULTISPECIES: BON domain-containing protein [Chryseobacterium]MDH5033485.1 BON domain-containing protein [Chryseobacterium cucumeris]QWT87070.1 BON domain-containing protein [Chryseobacterium sp. PCH239]WFB68276.1 BON domain-containing protein [Chryseobacterium sp. WX]
MKTNEQLQQDVQEAIKWEPMLHPAEIGVTASDGVVSLTGTVDSIVKKKQAENAARNVSGVKVLVENIQVKLPDSKVKTDIEIGAEIISAFTSNVIIPQDKIKVKVENGWVDLDGELPWDYQREITENAIQFLPGIKGIFNNITINPDTKDAVSKKKVEEALKRSAVDEREITVSVSGTTVTLTGTVHSWQQKEEAGRIAWKTPGIKHLKNKLEVDYEYNV